MLALIILIPFLCGLLEFLPLSGRWRILLLFFVSLFHACMTTLFWIKIPSPEFSGFLVLDSLGLILISIISALFLCVSFYLIGYFKHEKRSNRTFTVCISLLLSMMSLACVSYNMGLIWVAVAMTTLFSAPLISFHKNKQTLEATWKYLLVCSVGITLALMGTFFLAISAHSVNTLALPALVDNASQLTPNWLKLSIIFLLVGYGCKMGLAPMHSWKPETYGQATGMVVVLMAGLLTQCAFLPLLRLNQICVKAGLSGFYSSILIVMAVLSLAVPAIFILKERSIKRVFAYSSVEHMGILVLGLGLGGVGIYGALFHMINNALAKVVMFLTAGSIAQKYGSSRVDDVRGVVHVYPFTGIFLIAGFFAGAGMFPFATFHSELMILNSAVSSGFYFLAFLCLVFLALIFIGIAKITLEIALGEPTEPILAKAENIFMNTPIAVAIILLLGVGFYMPVALDHVLNAAVKLAGGLR